ncbi:TRAP-type C4-dicarboxylate transport system permease small subunit [Limimaricola soesokkakensis]|uniref:TRAP transporter small permease protein n=1 Tax=Limimaricola soesokkakensis TaxID=1343159 RepID=A0A1X6ZV79_9RHOB|nr:TRAP transporter small permease subunit [Limimaricola soesokkakensis]PSK81352.1 TRAP-type C4-dicarboxylate transport system permease small subunit [Limimaricola soesokkakensis]SLN62674.1 Tripartite ATP-independent periplasmic transporters, DctQ component [Limimaricola soesokkakensis]
MHNLNRISTVMALLLEWVMVALMVTLTVVVIVAVIARLLGESFSWYDEVAAIMLAWITYYGSALAALKRRHIGFDTVLLALPPRARLAALLFGEAVVLTFFALMAWAGFQVLAILEGSYLVSLTWVPVQFTQSVIPIGALLFILGQLLSLPDYWSKTARGISLEHAEIEEEVDTEMSRSAGHVIGEVR